MGNSRFLTYSLLLIAVSGLIGTGYFFLQTQNLADEKADIQKEMYRMKRAKTKPVTDKPKDTDESGGQTVKTETDKNIVEVETPSAEANIIIEKPAANATISSPVEVAGKARTFENTVNVKIKDKNGNLLAESYTTATGEMGQHSDYSTTIDYKASPTQTGSIEVFQYSAKDGTEIDKVVIPVLFK